MAQIYGSNIIFSNYFQLDFKLFPVRNKRIRSLRSLFLPFFLLDLRSPTFFIFLFLILSLTNNADKLDLLGVFCFVLISLLAMAEFRLELDVPLRLRLFWLTIFLHFFLYLFLRFLQYLNCSAVFLFLSLS